MPIASLIGVLDVTGFLRDVPIGTVGVVTNGVSWETPSWKVSSAPSGVCPYSISSHSISWSSLFELQSYSGLLSVPFSMKLT